MIPDKKARHYFRCFMIGLIALWIFVLWMLLIGVWASAPK